MSFSVGRGFSYSRECSKWLCHSQKSLRALNRSTVLPGSKGMVIVFEEHLSLHLKMGSLAYDIQGYGEGPLIALALTSHHRSLKSWLSWHHQNSISHSPGVDTETQSLLPPPPPLPHSCQFVNWPWEIQLIIVLVIRFGLIGTFPQNESHELQFRRVSNQKLSALSSSQGPTSVQDRDWALNADGL